MSTLEARGVTLGYHGQPVVRAHAAAPKFRVAGSTAPDR